jgi:hypothetical protein
MSRRFISEPHASLIGCGDSVYIGRKIKEMDYAFPADSRVSEEARALVKEILAKDPSKFSDAKGEKCLTSSPQVNVHHLKKSSCILGSSADPFQQN